MQIMYPMCRILQWWVVDKFEGKDFFLQGGFVGEQWWVEGESGVERYRIQACILHMKRKRGGFLAETEKGFKVLNFAALIRGV